MADLPAVTVDEETIAGVRNGMRFVGGPILDGPPTGSFGVLDPEGHLVAVYHRTGEHAVPEVVLPA